MAKDFNTILSEAQQIKNEIIEGANTALRTGTCLEDIVQRAESDEGLAAKKARTITAGNGLTGGGSLATDMELTVGATDDSIVVGADGIKVDTQDSLTSTSITKPLSAAKGKALQDTKANKTVTIEAGKGLTGGGDLSGNRTLNIESATDGITPNADNIQLNTIDNVTSTSVTKPLSANQGKVLNDKVVQVETDLNEIINSENKNISLSVNDISTKPKPLGASTVYIVSNLQVGDALSNVPIGAITGAFVAKIEIHKKSQITYPVLKTTSGVGCIIINKDNIVVWSHAETVANTGSLKTITSPLNSAYFLLVITPSMQGIDYSFNESYNELSVKINKGVIAKENLNEELYNVNYKTTIISKTDIQNSEIFASNRIIKVTDSVGLHISQVQTTEPNSPGANIYKIPITPGEDISYPVFLSTGGYGSLITDNDGIVLAEFLNSLLQTGTISVVKSPEKAAYFYLGTTSILEGLDYFFKRSIPYGQSIEQQIALKERNTESFKVKPCWLPFLSNYNDNSKNSLCLAAIKFDIDDNKIPFQRGYLFHKLPSDDGKIYYGTTLNNAIEIGQLDYHPKDYVLSVSPKDGTVIGVRRDVRGNIRVYNGANNSIAAKSTDGLNTSPKGWLYNSGVDFINDGADEYCIFSEYDGGVSDNQTLYIWKGKYPYTNVSDWKTVYSKVTSYNSGYPTPGSITHFHMVRRDPWTGILYSTTGDFSGQFFWVYSEDNGETWSELASDVNTKPSWVLDGQPLRCINFIFTKDYIYFATDHGSNNTLSRVSRDSNTGVISVESREVMSEIPYGTAVNSLCYVEYPNGLFLFTRIDTGYTGQYADDVKCLFWSFDDEKLYTVANIKKLQNTWGGHRGKCYFNYTNGQEPRPAMGFADNTRCGFDLVGADGINIGTIFYSF